MKGTHLKGSRISLSPVLIKDAKELANYFNEVKHFLGADISKRMTLKQEEDFIRKSNAQENAYFFAIRLKNKLIGSMSIFSINTHDGTAETGAMIGLSFADKGYGTEAKQLLLDFAFNMLGLRKIYSRVYSYNERSRAYSFKCGYVQEATLPEKKLYQGIFWDEWILSITKNQWEENYKQYKKRHLT